MGIVGYIIYLVIGLGIIVLAFGGAWPGDPKHGYKPKGSGKPQGPPPNQDTSGRK